MAYFNVCPLAHLSAAQYASINEISTNPHARDWLYISLSKTILLSMHMVLQKKNIYFILMVLLKSILMLRIHSPIIVPLKIILQKHFNFLLFFCTRIFVAKQHEGISVEKYMYCEANTKFIWKIIAHRYKRIK